jgi:hypothetical protein
MLRNIIPGCLLAVTILLLHPAPARADQSFTFNLGYFAVKPVDARLCPNIGLGQCDVLVANLDFLDFRPDDLSGPTIGVDWAVTLGNYLEAGVGIAYSRRTAPSVYADLQKRSGAEIEQDLKLRIAPITATVKLLPFGRRKPVQPYLGGGVGIFNWRYTETGEFVDFSDNAIFRDTFVADGTQVGPVAVVGVRGFPSDVFGLGFEVRWQKATGTLGPEFYGDRSISAA